jgi:hypothetical protein
VSEYHDALRAAAEAGFRARLAELGATLLESYRNSQTPMAVRCAAGHTCRPRPQSVMQGQGICRVCARQDPATAEAAFRARLAELGATLLEPVWLGSGIRHRVLCAAGHECTPLPDTVTQGGGICRYCRRVKIAIARAPASAASEAAFCARLAELGATLLEPAWRGAIVPHRVLCAAGHECAPIPNNVLRGRGVCRHCAGLAWDVFYVVTTPAVGRVKFGITSGDPRSRLGDHCREGYRQVVRLFTDLPGDTAPGIERAALAALNLARIEPIRGREHFDGSALAIVLDVADNYPRSVS